MNKKEFTRPLDEYFTERLRIKLVVQQGRLINFVVQYESLIGNKWKEIVRYDCAHDYFHRDLIYPDGEKIKKKITIFDLKMALMYAEQDITDRWEWYKEQYLKKI